MVDKHNPYIAGAPVVEQRMFFGRERVFEWIENSLSGKYVDHILVLHGQRRVGKTSVLKHIPNRLPDKYIPVFIDLQGRVSTTLGRFLGWLAREIVRALAAQGLELPRPDRKAFEEDPEYFENVFLPSIRNQMGERCLLLTFDEFDTFESTDAQEGLALPFMAILKRLMDHDYLNFIFSIGSSGRKLENMQAAYTSFFKQALYRKISFLEGEDARDLVIMPVEGVVRYEPEAVDRILQVTSRHPYFVQLVCHELFSECQKNQRWEVTGEDVENVLEPVVERGTVNLKFVWDEATALEKWIMAVLATVEEGLSQTEIEAKLKAEQVRHTHQELERAMLRLKDKDVITDDHHFVIHLFRMWLVRNRPLEQVREELEEVNPIVNRLLEIGQEYHSKGEYEDAVRNFEEALKVEGTNLDARQWLGSSQLERGDYGKAIAEFETVLEVKVDDVVAQKGFCEAYLAMGDESKSEGKLEEAEFAYQQVLGINPEHQAAHQRMAELHHKRAVGAIVGGPEAALEELEKALEYAEEGTFRQTRDELAAFISGDRKLAEVLFAWGQAAREKELWEDAQELLTAYRKESGDGQSVQEAIEEIRGHVATQRKEEIRHRAGRLERLGRYAEAAEGWGSYLKAAPEEGEKVRAKIAELQAAAKAGAEKKGGMSPIVRGVVVGTAVIVIGAIIALFTLPNSPLRAAFAEPTNTVMVVSNPTPTATQAAAVLDPDVQQALAYIQEQAPNFQNTFDFRDGSLVLTSLDGEWVSGYENHVSSSKYVIQVDLRFEPDQMDGTCEVVNGNYGEGLDARGLNLHFNGGGTIGIGRHLPPYGHEILAEIDIPADQTEFNTYTFMILGDIVSVFINEFNILSVNNPDGSVLFENQELTANGGAVTCEYDNLKLWDLTGLELAGDPAPTPAPTAIPLSWTRLNSGTFLERDEVLQIVFDPVDPDVMYAGTLSSGIYKTINGGITWAPASAGLGGSRIDALVINPDDPDILYAGVLGDGPYKTTDGGQSWTKLEYSQTAEGIWQFTTEITLNPNNPEELAFSDGFSIYWSTDGGGSWKKLIGGGEPFAELSFGPDGMVYYEGPWRGVNVGRVDPETKSHETFSAFACDQFSCGSSSGNQYNDVVAFSPLDGRMFVSFNESMYSSADGGESWQNTGVRCVWAEFTGSGQGLCIDHRPKYSDDGGIIWRELSVAGGFSTVSGAISPHDPDVIVLGGQSGIIKSTDGGRSWEDISSGIGSGYTQLLLNPVKNELYLAVGAPSDDLGEMYAAPIGGRNFEFWIDRPDEGNAYAYLGADGVLYRFYGIGQTVMFAKDEQPFRALSVPLSPWVDVEGPGHTPFGGAGGFVQDGQDVLYVIQNGLPEILFSYDGGDSWEKTIYEMSSNVTEVGTIFSDPARANGLYSYSTEVSYSADGGESWYRCGTSTSPDFWNSTDLWSLGGFSFFSANPEEPGRFMYTTTGAGLLASDSSDCRSMYLIGEDEGLTNPYTRTIARHPENLDTIYVGTANGFFVSYNGGQSWGPVNDGLLGAITIYSLAVDPNDPGVVYAATPYGVFQLRDN